MTELRSSGWWIVTFILTFIPTLLVTLAGFVVAVQQFVVEYLIEN